MNRIEQYVDYAVYISNNNYYGYSQHRRGERDKDCSLLVIHALKFAGYETGSATYTGNMLKPLLAVGFKDVTKTVNLKTGKGLIKGDILLRPKTTKRGGHAAIMINEKELVQAAGDLDGVPGDSSKQEIYIRKYYNSPFTYVLRDVVEQIKIGDIVTVDGFGYSTSYGEGTPKHIKGKGKIINVYDGRFAGYGINYTDHSKPWIDRFFPKSAIK